MKHEQPQCTDRGWYAFVVLLVIVYLLTLAAFL
jgi:hypothetical protein